MKAIISLLLGFTIWAFVLPSAPAQDADSLNLEPLSAWRNLRSGASAPRARAGAGMVFDDVRDVVLLHAGSTGPASVGSDTWSWDGIEWRLLALGPQAWAYGMAFDSTRGVAILFGGFGPASSLLGNTWAWDGSLWTDVTPLVSNPSPRGGCAMAWDPIREVIVLQGGALDRFLNVTVNDTWEWDGSSWHKIDGAGGPDRASHRMAYDAKRQVMVLFGGLDRHGLAPVDTWEYADGQWRQVSTQGPPGGRENVLLYYDPDLELTIMQGGGEWALHGFATTRYFTDTWAWDGQQWTELHPVSTAHEEVLSATSAYDAGRRQWVVFGGMKAIDTTPTLVDTLWEYQAFDWPRMRSLALVDDRLTVTWTGGLPPFQIETCTSLPLENWPNSVISTTQHDVAIPLDGSGQYVRIRMPDATTTGDSVHVAWRAQPPTTVLPSGNLRAEGWVRRWYFDADDDRWDGYNTVTIDALFDAQGALLEAGGDLTFREQTDSYTFADFVSGTFDTNLVVEGEILWDGRWTLYPPQNTAAVAFSPATGATTLLLHDAAHGEPDQISFSAWILDSGL